MFIVDILGSVMRFLYKICNNYGVAIILFTLFSKIVLLPISIWVQKNSIKMVKMQPDINKIKIKYFGDKDKIADEQAVLYKKEKYNAFASLIPLFIQIFLLLGLVEVINKPITYLADVPKEKVGELSEIALEKHNDLDPESSSIELAVFEDIKSNQFKEEYNKILDNKIKESIKKINMKFLGINLSWIASNKKGISWIVPILAGLSALLLCVFQNAINVLQAEQSKINKYGMMIFSVGLSLYLGCFVVAGVALYWVFSNIFAIIQQILLNIFINPKKIVNYEELEKTTKELQEMEKANKVHQTKEQKKKERQDYKRFFSVVNKHLVFYSESNGFYKYYKGIIEYLLENTNITIHYITSDYNDKIFELEKKNKQIKAYYIAEKKLITLMMKLEADIVVMTMPDLDNYHIKRSYLKKDIEYIFIPHSMDSLNMTMREKSMNNFDTIYVTDKYQRDEMEKTIKYYNLKNKKIIDWGYSLLDEMIEDYNKNKKDNKTKTVLIAPSWQKDNIVDLCLDELLNELKGHGYKVIVRPHPQHVRHCREKFENLKKQFSNDKNIEIQTDFSSNDTVFNADLLISDWSGIAYEYAYTTKKPVLFIDTPMKVMNPIYEKINDNPINIWSRTVIGEVIKLEELKDCNKIVEEMLNNKKKYYEKINNLINDSVYNVGTSSEVGANYIIESLQKIIKSKEKKNEK